MRLGWLFILMCCASFASAQNNLQGVVNISTPVIDASCNTLTVGSSAGFSPGEAVLVIQMKGATVDQTNTPTSGDVISYNNVGNYELNTIQSISGNTIVLQFPLIQSYDVTQKVQLISVPVNNDATVAGTVTAQPWNGNTGGVIAIICTGTLTMNADIDASGAGYMGGAILSGGFGCSNLSYVLSSFSGGYKGESIASVVPGIESGRGKWAGGGGGGNPGNSGGGGGALGSSGGLGGNEYSGCGATGVQGIGGQMLTYNAQKIFMGSGGGGGYADNIQSVTPGTNGGGIVIIRATNIDGNNFTIKANGLDQTLVANDESAGGGGSGGSVYLDIQNYISQTNVSINGGKGGDTYNNIFTTDCHGPGGGGSGGYLSVSQASIPVNLSYTATGGLPGTVLNPISSCYNTSFGGTSGNGSIVQDSLVIPESNLTVPTASLGNDTTICPNTNYSLQAPPGFTSYLWQDGSTLQSFAVTAAGTYSVIVTSGAGCAASDTVIVNMPPAMTFPPMNDTTICPEGMATLSVPGGFFSYQWSNGNTTSTINVTSTGNYSLTISDTIGCTVSDTAIVASYASPVNDLGANIYECEGGTIALVATPGYALYQWGNGETTDSILTSTPGTYYLTITDAAGCTASDSILFFNTPVTLEPVADAVYCPPYAATVTAPDDYYQYYWSDGSFGNPALIGDSGIYSVTVSDINGCTASDSFRVDLYCEPNLYCPNAFSPNNDAMNDQFRCLSYHVTEYELNIFNRWGQLMYHTSNIDLGWDGTFKNQLCPIGTYGYYVRYTFDDGVMQQKGIKKGNFTLLR